VTISSVVRDRIKTAYGLEAEIIPPPPGLRDGESRLPPSLTHVCSGFLLCVSRLLPYKNVDAVIEGASLAGEPLVIVGVGPELDRLRSLAGNHAHVLGSVSDAELRWLYANCRAVVAASFEDYGLTPLEGLSFRRPSVVLRGGGFLDTVIEDETGTFFDRPEPPLIADALRRSLAMTWNEGRLRSHASAFSRESFVARMRRLVEDVVEGDARAGVDGTSG
jgi:glycosyltransferase involved in cell wall biosynthesis